MRRRNRILFVDDEPSIRLTLPPVLEQHGFEVKAAGSIAEAVNQIEASRFDVLISDLNLEESGDGFRVVSTMPVDVDALINVLRKKLEKKK
jgi:DNA-binding response OmpR family regulator